MYTRPWYAFGIHEEGEVKGIICCAQRDTPLFSYPSTRPMDRQSSDHSFLLRTQGRETLYKNGISHQSPLNTRTIISVTLNSHGWALFSSLI